MVAKATAKAAAQSVAEFLDGAGLGWHAVALEDLGFKSVAALADEGLIDDNTLVSAVGFVAAEVAAFRTAVAAIVDEPPSSLKKRLSVARDKGKKKYG